MSKLKKDGNFERFKKFKITLMILGFVKPYRFQVIIIFIFAACSALLGLIPVYIMRPLTDKVLMPNVPASINERLGVLNALVLALLVIQVMKVLIDSVTEYRRRWLGEKISVNIKLTVYIHLQKLSMKFYNLGKTGDLQSRICHDPLQINYFLMEQLVTLCTSLMMCVGIGAILLYLKWKLALLILLPVPFIMLLSRIFFKKLILAYRAVLQKISNMYSIVLKGITAVAVIKTNVAEKTELANFSRANKDILTKQMLATRISLLFSPLKGLIMFTSGIMIYWMGGRSVIHGDLTLGELMVFIGYMWQFYTPIENIGEIFASYQNTIAAAERIFRLLNTVPEVADKNEAPLLPRIRGHVKFKNATFSYDGTKNAIENVSFEVNPGEVIGITGPNGSGKSTLVQLLCRLYDVSNGSISIDGHDIRDVKVRSLREQIGVILQDTILFYGTVAENIAYAAPSVSKDKIIAAAKTAGAHNFIIRLPDAYDTLIGERGMGLSGGERQRLAIARAILKDPKIIIFDEASSALDSASEAFIFSTISSLARNHTVFVISHRVGSLKKVVDRLYILDKGRMSEIGTSDQSIEVKEVVSSSG